MKRASWENATIREDGDWWKAQGYKNNSLLVTTGHCRPRVARPPGMDTTTARHNDRPNTKITNILVTADERNRQYFTLNMHVTYWNISIPIFPSHINMTVLDYPRNSKMVLHVSLTTLFDKLYSMFPWQLYMTPWHRRLEGKATFGPKRVISICLMTNNGVMSRILPMTQFYIPRTYKIMMNQYLFIV